MPGHVFIIQGDIRNLACDHWAVPCDDDEINPEAKAQVFEKAKWTGKQRGKTVRWNLGEFYAENKVRKVVGVPEGQPQPWLLNTVPSNDGRDPHDFAEIARHFLGVLPRAKSIKPLNGRLKPLAALPIIGTGGAGGEDMAGSILKLLLRELYKFVKKSDWDIALVAPTDELHDAAQASRSAIHREAKWTGDRIWNPRDLTKENIKLADDLSKKLWAGKVALFLGAGVSQGAGIPGWGGLLEKLRNQAGGKPFNIAKKHFEQADFRDRASALAKHMPDSGDDTLKKQIAAVIEEHPRYALAHAFLGGLPINEVVTTNYDKLFEKACEAGTNDDGEIHFRPKIHTLPRSKSRLRRDTEERWILKLHGCVSKPNNIVITREDYLRFATERDAFSGVLQGLMLTRHMLFVGFSLTDEGFHRIAWEVSRALERIGAATTGELNIKTARATALFPQENPMTKHLWGNQLLCVNFKTTQGTPALRVGIRQQEIFLDYLQSKTRGNAYLLKDNLKACLSEKEQALKEALDALQKTLTANPKAKDCDAYGELQKVLRGYGMKD